MNFWKKILKGVISDPTFFLGFLDTQVSPGLNKSKIEIYKGKTSEVSKDFDIVKGGSLCYTNTAGEKGIRGLRPIPQIVEKIFPGEVFPKVWKVSAQDNEAFQM